MWLFTRYGFFSVSVDHLGNLAVRARTRKHLEDLIAHFPDVLKRAKIIQTKKADYHYRIILSKATWSNILVVLAEEQTWGNFKEEAHRFQNDLSYKHLLHSIWYEMLQYGQEWEDEEKK